MQLSRIAVPLGAIALVSVFEVQSSRAEDRMLVPVQQATQEVAKGSKPWQVGEKLTYNAKINFLSVGQGVMTVEGIDTLRGRTVYHTTFRVRGRMLFFKVDDSYESWFDTTSLSSLRYKQNINETSYKSERLFEFFPERATFSENGKPEEPSVADPLDDGSFIYFVRTVPLELGSTYEFNRYFRPDRNPVRIQVLRRERITVPAGTFDCIVVRPIIKTKGIFSENGHAEVWIADDSSRVMVQMKSRLSFGSLNLYLKSYRPPSEAAAAAGSR